MAQSDGLAAQRMPRSCEQRYERQLHDFQIPYRDFEGFADNDPPILAAGNGGSRRRAGRWLSSLSFVWDSSVVFGLRSTFLNSFDLAILVL
jgi:hypothetical protein